MSFFLGLKLLDGATTSPLYAIFGNPSQIKVPGQKGSLASSISIYQGEEIDLIKQLGLELDSELLQKVDEAFFAVNNKTNELKIWASCSLKFEYKSRSIQCLKQSKINLGYRIRVVSSKTDSLLPSPISTQSWYRYYGLIVAPSKNMTCLIQLTFLMDPNTPSEGILNKGCIRGVFKHAEFSIVKETNHHFLLLCQDQECGVYSGNFTGSSYKSKILGKISSENQEIRPELKVEFVKEISPQHGYQSFSSLGALQTPQFIIKSSTRVLNRGMFERSQEKKQSPKSDKMVNYYHISIEGRDQDVEVRITEWHLLHSDFDLQELQDPFHYLSYQRDRFYQAVYFSESLKVSFRNFFARRGGFTLYDRRVIDFGIKKITNAFRLDEELIAVVGDAHQDPKKDIENRKILVILAMFKELHSYHERGSRTNLDTLRFRQEFRPGITINNIFGLISASPGEGQGLQGYFVIEAHNITNNKTSYILNHTLDTTPIRVDRVKGSEYKTNLPLGFQVYPEVDQSKSNHKSNIMETIQFEVFINKIYYDFELKLKNQKDLPVLKLGSNKLDKTLSYTGHPISFELIRIIDKETPESPRLIKKYTLARQSYQNWTGLKRHENRMVIKVQNSQKDNLQMDENYTMNGKTRRVLESGNRLNSLKNSLDETVGVANCIFYLFKGDQKVSEIPYKGSNSMISDVYYYKPENLTILTFLETVSKNEPFYYKAKIFIHIYNEKMNQKKKNNYETSFDFKPLYIDSFKPDSAQYLVILVRGKRGQYALIGIANRRISLIMKDTMMGNSRVPVVVLRLKNKINILLHHRQKEVVSLDMIMSYSFKFSEGFDMFVETRKGSHITPYANQVTSMVCREYESGQLGDFVAHCVLAYENLGNFYLKLKENIDESPVYFNRLLEGQGSPLEQEILKDSSELKKAHYWDLNDDLIVKVKLGENFQAETGIKVWELRDRTKYTLEEFWPTKYNDQLPRMGFSTQVALVRSINDYTQISMFFNRATELWDNTIIRYDIDSHDIISIPDLEYADLNLNVIMMRFVYGDRASIKNISLKDLVQVEKMEEKTDNETLYLSLLVVFTAILILILGLWVYYLCIKKRVKKLIEKENKNEGKRVLVIKGAMNQDLDYSSLDVTIGDYMDNQGEEMSAIELKPVEDGVRKEILSKKFEKVTSYFF